MSIVSLNFFYSPNAFRKGERLQLCHCVCITTTSYREQLVGRQRGKQNVFSILFKYKFANLPRCLQIYSEITSQLVFYRFVVSNPAPYVTATLSGINELNLGAIVYRLYQKTVYPPSKSGRFSVNLYPIVRHIFHPICINLLELNTKVFHFLQSYKGFIVLISLFPFIIFENVTEQ